MIKKLLFLLSTIFALTQNAFCQTWVKATSMEDIKDGISLIFVCEQFKTELSEISDNYGIGSPYVTTPNGSNPFIVEIKNSKIYLKNSSNKYMVGSNDDTYIKLVSSSDKQNWEITISEQETKIKFAKNGRYLRYSSDSNSFRLYSSSSYLSTVSIYIEKTSKDNRNLKFENAEYTADLGETFTSPKVQGEATGGIWSSSNTAVASVNESTGEVTPIGVGTTTISITTPETDEYFGATASYQLIVTDNANIRNLNMNFTSGSKIENWGITLPYKGYNIAIPSIYFEEIKLSPKHGSTITSIYNDSNGKYSLRIYTGGNIALSVPDAYEITNIEITGEALNKGIANLKASIESSTITWSGKTQSFCYESNNGTCIIHTINITYVPCSERPSTKKVTISSAGLATFSSAHAWKLPADLSATTGVMDGDRLKLKEFYTEGSVIPAETGVILMGETGEYTLTSAAENEGEVDDTNVLKPALTNQTIQAEEGHKLFILANDANNGLGFYYQGAMSDGTTISKIGEKAYLHLPASINTRSLTLQLPETSQINNIVSQAKESNSIYTLQGKRLNAVNLPAGIYIVNGKKFIK